MSQELQIVIKGGQVRFIHDDDLAEAFQGLGKMTTTRASHVEPSGDGWTADLAPVSGPILGPYPRRDMALAAEVKWLQDHNTPVPQ
jgi:hypothetical protein